MSGSTWDFVSGVSASRLARRFGGGFGGLFHRIGQAVRALATRRQLAELDDRMLKDLGISRAQARFEASRAPWDIVARRWR